MNKIGNMYQVKKWFWLLFPSKETAAAADLRRTTRWSACPVSSPAATTYLSEQLNCTVSYISANDFVVLLETDGNYKKVLTSNGELSWTCFDEGYNECFEEVKER